LQLGFSPVASSRDHLRVTARIAGRYASRDKHLADARGAHICIPSMQAVRLIAGGFLPTLNRTRQKTEHRQGSIKE